MRVQTFAIVMCANMFIAGTGHATEINFSGVGPGIDPIPSATQPENTIHMGTVSIGQYGAITNFFDLSSSGYAGAITGFLPTDEKITFLLLGTGFYNYVDVTNFPNPNPFPPQYAQGVVSDGIPITNGYIARYYTPDLPENEFLWRVAFPDNGITSVTSIDYIVTPASAISPLPPVIATPLPGSLWMLGSALIGLTLGGRGLRRRKERA